MRTRCSESRLLLVAQALACAAALSGCAKQAPAPPPAPPEPPPPSAWPEGHTAPLKITDSLSLEIPLKYERSAIHGEPTAQRALISTQSDRSEAQFDFFLPDFSGYTLQNYRSDADENKVEVVYLHAGNPHEGELDAPGEYPPNMLKRALADFLDPKSFKDQYGLRCYQGRTQHERLTCYGRRSKNEDIVLTVLVPPYAEGVTFPQMQARYFSKRYGGVRIAWRAHVSNLPRWREIDEQIWKFLEAWKVAAAPAAPPAPGGPQPAGR